MCGQLMYRRATTLITIIFQSKANHVVAYFAPGII